jgi:hypothetical protein
MQNSKMSARENSFMQLFMQVLQLQVEEQRLHFERRRIKDRLLFYDRMTGIDCEAESNESLEELEKLENRYKEIQTQIEIKMEGMRKLCKEEEDAKLKEKEQQEAESKKKQEDELQRRLWESNAELEQPIQISETQVGEQRTEEVAEEADEIAISMQEKEDAIVETDSQTSASPAGEVSDVTSESSEIATATPNEMQLYQGISLHKVTLTSITLSDELRLYLLSSDVQLRGISQQRDVCARWNDSRFVMQIQQSPVLSSRNEKHACALPSEDKMQTVLCLISQMLIKATKSKTTDELGVRDKQLCAETRTHPVIETTKDKREIAAKKPTERKQVKQKPECEAATVTTTSTSRDDFHVEGEEEEDRGRQHQCWNYKSRHKPEVNKKLRAQYQVVIGLQVVNNKTKSTHLCFGKLSFSLLAEHEEHCVGPGLVEPPSRDPT